MEEIESISSILSGSSPSKGEVATVASPAPPAEALSETPKSETPSETKELSRDEAGRFAKPVEKTEQKAEEKPALTKADVAAIIDERRKRQQLEQQLQQYQQQKPKTDIWENPDAAINERMQEYLAPFEETIFGLRLELAKQKMPDFDDAAVSFFTAAQSDPVLKHQADTAPDQFAYIYREGKRIKELGDVGGDILKYRDKVTGEFKGELAKRDEQIKALTAQLEQFTKSQKELAAVPTSLNSVQSSAAPKAEDADPDDIKQLVRFGNKRA